MDLLDKITTASPTQSNQYVSTELGLTTIVQNSTSKLIFELILKLLLKWKFRLLEAASTNEVIKLVTRTSMNSSEGSTSNFGQGE